LFKSVVSNFVESWKSPSGSNAPFIEKVYEVGLSWKARNRFDAYRTHLNAKKSATLEHSTFHSSQCICDLGTKQTSEFCDYPSCGICSSVKSSFSHLAFGATHNDGAYGSGIYSYTNSSRADKHATSCISSPYRVMIMCSALTSKSYARRISSYTRSVVDGDTVVVGDADAIIPTHVIMYSNV